MFGPIRNLGPDLRASSPPASRLLNFGDIEHTQTLARQPLSPREVAHIGQLSSAQRIARPNCIAPRPLRLRASAPGLPHTRLLLRVGVEAQLQYISRNIAMIQATRRWFRRNRTNFAVGAGVLGAGYLAGQYVLGKLGEARQRMSDERIAKEKYADSNYCHKRIISQLSSTYH